MDLDLGLDEEAMNTGGVILGDGKTIGLAGRMISVGDVDCRTGLVRDEDGIVRDEDGMIGLVEDVGGEVWTEVYAF